ncbi:MAG: hypothetical protein AAF389_12170 [Gemmatimonadota bacterium]
MPLLGPQPDRYASRRRVRRLQRFVRPAATVVLVAALTAGIRGAAAHVEHEAQKTIRAALDAEEMTWVQLKIDGRTAQLRGKRPSLGQGGEARRIVEAARCDVFGIPVSCVADIRADFGEYQPGRKAD